MNFTEAELTVAGDLLHQALERTEEAKAISRWTSTTAHGCTFSLGEDRLSSRIQYSGEDDWAFKKESADPAKDAFGLAFVKSAFGKVDLPAIFWETFALRVLWLGNKVAEENAAHMNVGIGGGVVVSIHWMVKGMDASKLAELLNSGRATLVNTGVIHEIHKGAKHLANVSVRIGDAEFKGWKAGLRRS